MRKIDTLCEATESRTTGWWFEMELECDISIFLLYLVT